MPAGEDNNERCASMKLSDFSKGRDNNFNLIRIAAALAVLVSHSFILTMGRRAGRPLRAQTGMEIGDIAVDVFFITSGFLVTGSLLTRQRTLEFVWARVLRIYPALLLTVFATVFVLGPLFTTLPLSAYLSDSSTYGYLAKCSTLFGGISIQLPGVFDDNPHRSFVNMSLWTLPYEVWMYAFLAAGWFALLVTRQSRVKALTIGVIIYAALSGSCVLGSRCFHWFPDSDFARLSFMFFTGATYCVLKEHITLSRPLFWLLLVMLLLSFWDRRLFSGVYVLSLAYIVLFLAYIPSGFIRQYNHLGDYSYGMYIYAYPIQQSVAALVPGVSALSMIVISAVPTIVFAVMSWHFLERRALALKGTLPWQHKMAA